MAYAASPAATLSEAVVATPARPRPARNAGTTDTRGTKSACDLAVEPSPAALCAVRDLSVKSRDMVCSDRPPARALQLPAGYRAAGITRRRFLGCGLAAEPNRVTELYLRNNEE